MKGLFKTAIFTPLLLLPMLGGCSGGSGDREEIVVDIQGHWTLEATLDQDQGDATCQITDLTLTIRMQGNTRLFGGESTGGRLSCTGGEAGSLETDLPIFVIGTGLQESGTDVSFTLSPAGGLEEDGTFLDLEGSLSTSRMEGQIQGFFLLEDLGGLVAFQGTFVNRRTS